MSFSKYPTNYALILLAVLFIAGTAHAQFGDVIDQQEVGLGFDEFSAPAIDITVAASGMLGSTASLTAKTANIDDNTSTFEWYLDDVLSRAQSGKAKTAFAFTTTKQLHIIRLVVSSGGETITENTVSVSSFNVSLVWHADTFVPASYEGKALPIVGSRVTVIALPEIRNENPENLLYTWSVNAESRVRNVLDEQEFSFFVTKNVSFVSIMVEVSNLSKSVTVKRAINVPVVKPSVVLYHNKGKDGSGLSNKPLFIAPGTAISILAQPFYFHTSATGNLSYEWEFIGKNVSGVPPDPNILRLTIPESSESGKRFLRVRTVNQKIAGE